MKKLFHPLLELIANASENELAAIIQHLKEENRILRDKLPKRVQLTDEERQRLVKTGSPPRLSDQRDHHDCSLSNISAVGGSHQGRVV